LHPPATAVVKKNKKKGETNMKKSLALILSLLMLFSLVACGGGDSGKDSSNDTPSTSSDSGKTDDKTGGDAADSDSQETSSLELKGPGNVTLKRLGANVAFDPNNDINADVLKQSTGYDVEYFMLPAENADEKLLMDVSGGADYDAVNVTISQYRTLMAQGALQPLDDALDQYGQDILAGNSDKVWDALRGEDGHIYAVPYMYPHSHEIAMFMAARLDLMKAAGINELPTTIDEFYDCLVTLKEYYGDEYIILAGPFKPSSEGNENWVIPKTIACAFGIYNDWMVDENGKVYYMTEAPGFADMIAFLTKLYDEGLIDPDWAVNTESTLKEKFTSGKAIITCGNRALADFCSAALIENLNLSWDDLGYISALKGPDGTCTYQSTEAFNFVTCVPKSSKNVADVVNWWNLRVKDQLFIAIGEEGVHFNYDADGNIEPINPIFAEERGNSYWYMDVTNQKEYEFEWPSRVRKSEGQWHSFSAVTMNADQSIFVDNIFAFMPAKENYAKYNTTIFNDLQDYITQVMSGTRTIDDLDTFMSDWTNAGGEKVREELQSWYDEFYK